MPVQSPAANRMGHLAQRGHLGPPLGRQAMQHARQVVIPALAVATDGVTFHLAVVRTTQTQRRKH